MRAVTITQGAEVTGRSPSQSPSLAAASRGADTRNPMIQAMKEPLLEEIHVSVGFGFDKRSSNPGLSGTFPPSAGCTCIPNPPASASLVLQ